MKHKIPEVIYLQWYGIDERDKLRAEVEQYKVLLDQAKTLRRENMQTRTAMTRIAALAGGIRVLTGEDSDEHSLATSIAKIAAETLQATQQEDTDE